MKRRITAAVTFVAGLYYVLEFLTPAHIGGAPDAAGAFGGWLDVVNGRTMLVYTGIRQDGPPRILQTLYPGGAGRVDTCLAPSPFRASDYNGAMNPQIAGERLYYIGLGWDDRSPGVCVAKRQKERWIPAARPVLERGPSGSWDASGITWASVLPPSADRLWRLWYIGRQGDLGRVGFATSPDGIHWRKRPAPVLSPEDGGSIESVSIARTNGRLWALLVSRNLATGKARLGRAWVLPDGGTLAGKIATVRVHSKPSHDVWQAWVPERVNDARILGYAEGPAAHPVMLSVRGEHGRIFLAEGIVLERRNAAGVPVLELNPQPVKMPGRQPISTGLSDVRNQVDDLIVVIGAFAIGLGLVSLTQVHGRRIRRLAPGWPESAAFFITAGSMTFFTLYTRMHPHGRTWASAGYNLLFFGLLQPLGSSMFALLAAYLVSAAYRAFRIRNLEASLMTAAAVLVMLGQVPVGNLLTRALPDAMQIPTVMAWILYVANNAVVRAINFGVFVGAIATALRIWLSMDRGFDVAGQ
ncbi:MAG: hypothetical protein ACP5VE_08605 [Chthonomonadales bacterium]